MPDQELFRAQTGPEDGVLFSSGYHNSVFAAQPLTTYSDKVRKTVITPLQDVQTGKRVTFDIEKDAVLLEDLFIKYTKPALALGLGATYARYQDWGPLADISSIDIRYVSNAIVRYETDKCYSDILFMPQEKQDAVALNLFGNLSAAQRNTIALQPHTPFFQLPTPWKGIQGNELCISALANKITFVLQFRPAPAIVQSDGAKLASLMFTNVEVHREAIQFLGSDRAELTSIVLGPGMNYPFTQTQSLNWYINANQLGPGLQPISFLLTDIDGPCPLISFFVRTQAQMDETSADPAFFELDDTLLDGLTWQADASGIKLLEPKSYKSDLPYIIGKYFQRTPPAVQQGLIMWTEHPEAKNTSCGHTTFSSLTNPRAFLQSTVANAQPLVITFIPRVINWLNTQGGDAKTIWR